MEYTIEGGVKQVTVDDVPVDHIFRHRGGAVIYIKMCDNRDHSTTKCRAFALATESASGGLVFLDPTAPVELFEQTEPLKLRPAR